MLTTFSQKLTLQEAFETVVQVDEELKGIRWSILENKNLRLLGDRLSSFFPKTVKKIIHQKKKEINKHQGSLNSVKAIAVSAICPVIVHFII